MSPHTHRRSLVAPRVESAPVLIARPWLWVLVTLASMRFAPSVMAPQPPLERYERALSQSRRELSSSALEELRAIALEWPQWVPAHRAMVLLSAELGRLDELEAWFDQRLAVDPGDIGALAGKGLLQAELGRKSGTFLWLERAILAGSRDPLLAGPLIRAASQPTAIVAWLDSQAEEASLDQPLAALAVRAAIEAEDLSRAHASVMRALERHPDSGDLYALASRIEWLRGAEQAACRWATLGTGYLAQERSIPELRIARRSALARALNGCQRAAEALQTLSPVLDLPLLTADESLRWRALAARAEAELIAGDPLGALATIESQLGHGQKPTRDEPLLESVRARASSELGIEIEPPLAIPDPETAGLDPLLEWVCASLANPTRHEDSEPLVEQTLERIAARFERAGMERRAGRVMAALAWRSASLDRTRQALGAAMLSRQSGREAPEIEAAITLTIAREALSQSNPQRVLDQLRRIEFDTIPSIWRARLRAIGAQAARQLGEFALAADWAKAGVIDLREFERDNAVVAPELVALLGDTADLNLELIEASYRALRATGSSVDEAGAILLREVRSAVRRWSQLEPAWPETVQEWRARIPKQSCAIVAMGPDNALALVANPDHVEESTTQLALSTGSCREARLVLWAGPGRSQHGLDAGVEGRLLLRWVGLTRAPSSSKGTATLSSEWRVPQGGNLSTARARILRQVITNGERFDLPAAALAADPALGPFFYGLGLTSSRSPLSSGWLIPVSPRFPDGWLGSDQLSQLSLEPKQGVIAIGLRRLGSSRLERGGWTLAESILAAGARWTLFSTEPLAEELRNELLERRADWQADPLKEARGLLRRNPRGAAGLQLWTAEGRLIRSGRDRSLDTLLLIPTLAAIAVAIMTIARLVSRRRSALRGIGSADQHPPSS